MKNILLYHGEETYLRDRALEELRREHVPAGLEAFNYERLDGKGLSLSALRDAVEPVPVMGARRLVTVRDYDLYQGGEGERARLTALLTALPDTALLVFVYDAVPFKEDRRTKLYALLRDLAEITEFPRQKGSALERFVRERFAAYGKEIPPAEVDYLLHRCGDLMGVLDAECAKVAHYAPGPRVTRADIDAVATPALSAVAFDITDALAEKRHGRAMELLLELRQLREEPILILGAVGKNLRGLYAARLCLDGGRGEREVQALMGYRSAYPAQKLLRAAARFSLPWCRRAVTLCAEADRQLKGGASDRDRVLEWLIAELAFGEAA